MKKNCENCTFLGWSVGDEGWSEGYVCNKRIYRTDREEVFHFSQLDNKNYREHSKKCHKEITEMKDD